MLRAFSAVSRKASGWFCRIVDGLWRDWNQWLPKRRISRPTRFLRLLIELRQARKAKRDIRTSTAFFMAAGNVFMDSAGFLALWDSGDEHHALATSKQRQLSGKGRRFVTTDYIVDETVTLLLVRHSHAAATDFLDSATRSQGLRWEWIDSDRFYAAASVFRRHNDKEWSFTDCCSFVIMRELGITEAFTTDHHFRQAGFDALLTI